ncbi:MAG: type II toxin-antitoxin system VapC family toxin [Anaerolineae bacterium]|nr:type II toxin-antitoxin system VapC family toxin [Anaerolineae bacterium]
MRRYLLDTAVVAALLHDRPPAVALCTPWLRRRETATSILVYGEVAEYIKGLSHPVSHLMRLRTLLRGIRPYFLTYAVMEHYADIRRQLRPPHGPGLIGDVDTLIAATALDRNLTVVTVDTDFQRVPELKVQLISL